MIIEPRIRNNISMDAHPVGCAKRVKEHIEYIQKQIPGGHAREDRPQNVLVIGASTGFGLDCRIAAAFGYGAKTLGVAFEKEGSPDRTATAGWYNLRAFDGEAEKAGLWARSINGDAFSNEVKAEALDIIEKDMGKVDLVIYSLASPVRTDPNTGQTYRSVLKPIGSAYTAKSLNFLTGELSEFSVEPATPGEIDETVKVMGGEDWKLWLKALAGRDLLAEGLRTVAFSYIGPEVTYPIYRQGTIGRAKEDLEKTAGEISRELAPLRGSAYVSVNKALVTRASAVIPVVSLYIAILYHLMKANGTHEGTVQQAGRLFRERLYTADTIPLDDQGRIRIDDLEMAPEIQGEIARIWPLISQENLDQFTDLEEYRREFMRMNGFEVDGVDYAADVDPS